MKGKVRTKESCPVCTNPFQPFSHPITKDIYDLMCPKDRTTPRRFYVDGRSFKNRRGTVGYLFRDERGMLFDSFLAAKRMLEAIRHDYDKDPLKFDPTRWSKMGRQSHKLSDVWGAWEEEVTRTRSRTYAVHVELFGRLHVLPVLGEIDVRELTKSDLQKLDIAMQYKGLSEQTRITTMNYMGTVLHYARDNKMIGTDDIPKFPVIKKNRKDRWWIGQDVQEQIAMQMPEWTRLLMAVLYETGMRPGEGVALKKRDILPERKIHVQRALDPWRKEGPPKNGRPRYCDIPEDLYQAIMQIPSLPDAYLFTNSKGRVYSTQDLSHLFRKAANRAGYPQVTLYTAIRHSTASRIKIEAQREAEKKASEKLGNTVGIAREHYIQGGHSRVLNWYSCGTGEKSEAATT